MKIMSTATAEEPKELTRDILLRLPSDLISAIDKYAARLVLKGKRPRSRNQTVRDLLILALKDQP
jgi:hypothetical protein